MATEIIKTIGSIATGAVADGDYPNLEAWKAACPANLVAVDQIWHGKLLDGEHLYTTTPLVIAAATTTADANCYMKLSAVNSFRNHANKATNPLRYDATKGAAIKHTGTSGWAIAISVPYTRIEGIQILVTETGSTAAGAILTTGTEVVGIDINGCILESAARVSGGTISLRGTGSYLRNSLVIQRTATASCYLATLSQGASAYNVTFIATGTTLTNGLQTQYVPGVLKNIYVGGATNPHNGGSAMTFANCYSDVATANFTLAPKSTATFENVTDGTHDFRTVSGSALRNAGVTDVTTAATDIYGVARPQGAAYDVGAWEAPVAAADPVLTIGWTEENDTHAAVVDVEINGVAMAIGWTESNDTHSAVLAVDTASGQLTTRVIRNNNGIARTNLAGCAINIYNATTGALVLRQTGLTTNAEGRLVVLNAALSKATTYAYEIDLTAASMGRRLPTAVTV